MKQSRIDTLIKMFFGLAASFFLIFGILIFRESETPKHIASAFVCLIWSGSFFYVAAKYPEKEEMIY